MPHAAFLEKIVRTTSRTTKWCGVMQAKICSIVWISVAICRRKIIGDGGAKVLRPALSLPKEMRIV
jgi:hypothetical protein